ncbi:MAG TPA: hypothetical protein VMC85_16200 [Desulfomonilaceae bacterium]|nr:hypothetical protein [Desulfomonilaceae bacterium]
MGKKKKPPVDVFERRRVERLVSEPLIKKKWPQVAKLILEFEYEDNWFHNPLDPKIIKLGPDHQAFFDFDCRYNEGIEHKCRQGGFDLTGVVWRMIESGETETSGEIKCPGWRQGTGMPFHCLLTLKYRIRVHYKGETEDAKNL